MIKNVPVITDLTTADFFYDLPEELIAQTPAEPRDSSRLMVLRKNGGIEHRVFRDITDFLRPNDTLVINNSRVIPARIFGRRDGGYGEVELLLLRQRGADVWETLVRPGKRAKIGAEIIFCGADGGEKLRAHVTETTDGGNRIVRFAYDRAAYKSVYDVLHEIGSMPLPPYITRKVDDPERYQTVYSKEEGSAAAPTAGLHFTPELLDKIRAMGVAVVPVMLHVGLGTFRPVKVDKINNHVMHSEFFSISEEAAETINERKKNGGRVVAVGTTSCRVLESASSDDGTIAAATGDTGIFIYPGYRFKTVDSLITNFHLPESTLIMLTSALTGKDRMLSAYSEAVKEKYRFFSFGDAMLIE